MVAGDTLELASAPRGCAATALRHVGSGLGAVARVGRAWAGAFGRNDWRYPDYTRGIVV